MHAYFDSSLVLSVLWNEPDHRRALQVWRNCEVRYSSLLLRIESMIALRRAILGSTRPNPDVLARKELELHEMMVETVLMPVDERVSEVVRQERDLARCRSLDAVHLATALFILRETGESLVVCSYDARMRDTARGLGFQVLP